MEAALAVLQSPELWSGFVGAVIGGLMSLLGSWIATGRAHRQQRHLLQEQERKDAAKRAFSAFLKLKVLNEEVANLKRHIDEMFADATGSGDQELEPFAKVMELIGDRRAPEHVPQDDLLFLVDCKRAALLDEVVLVQKRVFNVLASMATYCQLRREFFEFAENNSDKLEVTDGTRSGNEFTGKMAAVANMKVGRLNNLLGQIMQYLEREVEDTWALLEQVKGAAESHFGADFPKVKLEKVA